MQACIKTDLGKVEMLDVSIPEPGDGEIVVKMTMATVCGSDMHFLDEYPNVLLGGIYAGCLLPEGLPMGHEGVGTVHAVGPGVTRFQPGERVISSCLVGCGSCAACLRGDYSMCTGTGGKLGRVLFGCQGEYFRVPFAEVNVAKVPDGVSDEAAMLATDIMSTGFGAIDRAEASFGDSVAVFAQGPLGLCATAGARARGCGLVIGVDTVPERLEVSKKVGATVVINAKEKDPVAEIAALTNNQGDSVTIGGKQKHVIGYMKDFLFLPEQARTPISALSGGERGRLMLARALAQIIWDKT